MELLFCRLCRRWKSHDAFYRAIGTRSGRRTECAACNLAYKAARYQANPYPARQRTQDWRRDNPERFAATRARFIATGGKALADRRSHLKRKFGLTVEEYDAMLEEQGGGCVLCGHPGYAEIALHVDHDHATGRVRGLLCVCCNNGLGQFRENPELLRAAARYVETHGASPDGGARGRR